MKEAADKYQGANLYVKNLDDSIGDDKLKELFSLWYHYLLQGYEGPEWRKSRIRICCILNS